MSEVSLFFKVKLKEGCADDFLAAVAPVAAYVRESEPGTLEYRIHTALGDPDVVWFYERYADDAAMATHAQSAAVTEMFGKVAPFMDGAPEMLPGACVEL